MVRATARQAVNVRFGSHRRSNIFLCLPTSVITDRQHERTHATSFCYRSVPAVFRVRSIATFRTTNVRVAGATPASISFTPQQNRALCRRGGGEYCGGTITRSVSEER
ncbi:hypothetical protein Zmor_020336 [Zophobas morio]|uniref:Uncharacterized protein n=1 Tax=Zophobas morio TaxID=2755281 RepID=A0AA38I356_9CUCU|nr:hypothetical protein Zmor_020336 [Zophobas morio]